MTERSLVEALTDLGLEELEAEIYVTLLRNGSSRAGAICSLSDASRGKVYDVLGSLVSQGFAGKSASTPAVYEASDPREVFDVLRRNLQRRQEFVDLVEERTADALEALQAAPAVAVDHNWELIEGRASIYDRLRQDVETAEDRIAAATNHNITTEPIPAVEQTWKALVDRAAGDLDVSVAIGTSTAFEPGWQDEDALSLLNARQFEHDGTIHFALVDDLVYLWLVPSERNGIHQNDDVTARSNAPGLRAAIEALFERLWAEADPLVPVAST